MSAKRTQPHDYDAERSVIGLLLSHGQIVDEVAGLVASADFYDPKHEVIYDSILAVHRSSTRVDLVSVANEMRRAGTMDKLGAVGCEAYLAKLAGAVCMPDGIEAHAGIVRDKSLARRLIAAGERIQALGYADAAEVGETFGQAQRELAAVTQRVEVGEVMHVRGVIHESIKELERRYHNRRAVTGIPMDLEELDEMSSGWQGTDLIVVAARPSMGKTAFAVDAALGAARAGHPTLLMSTEMGRVQIGNRLLSSDGRVDGMLMRTGFLESIDWIRLTSSAGRVAQLPIWVDDSRQTVETIGAKLRKWKRDQAIFKNGDELGLAVIDYLQLIKSADPRAHGSREREIALITNELKQLAKELGLAVMLLSQLNRDVEKRADKRPQMSDLRDSGAIEQDADVIIGLYRDGYYNKKSERPDEAEIIIMKQRNGVVGTARARYFKESTHFANLPGRSAA
jgi:replicative DNA helicase